MVLRTILIVGHPSSWLTIWAECKGEPTSQLIQLIISELLENLQVTGNLQASQRHSLQPTEDNNCNLSFIPTHMSRQLWILYGPTREYLSGERAMDYPHWNAVVVIVIIIHAFVSSIGNLTTASVGYRGLHQVFLYIIHAALVLFSL